MNGALNALKAPRAQGDWSEDDDDLRGDPFFADLSISTPLEVRSATVDTEALAPWRELVPGAVIGGSYRLVRHIARGGMGDVYLATHERLHSQFVVKVPSPDNGLEPTAISRFRHEAELMIAARHPNVVQVVDFNVTELGLPYLVMEYVQGVDLSQLLVTQGPLPPVAIVDIVRQLASALDAAHARGIVHRDLKPENIMLVPRPGEPGLVKIIDFGISKARQVDDPVDSWALAGTPDFMAPEQVRGSNAEADGRSDQFSLSVIVYLLLAGRIPWAAKDSRERLERPARDGVHDRPLPLFEGSCWRRYEVEGVLARGMAHAPDDRFDTLADFSTALERAMIADGLVHGVLETIQVGSGASSSLGNVPRPLDGSSECVHSRPGGARLLRLGKFGKFGGDGALVLAAVFAAVWMGSIDASGMRQRAAVGWRSVAQVVHAPATLATLGGSLKKVWTNSVADLPAVRRLLTSRD